jgi:hypothetical protein
MSDSDSDAHVTNDEEEEELNVSLSIPRVYEKKRHPYLQLFYNVAIQQNSVKIA